MASSGGLNIVFQANVANALHLNNSVFTLLTFECRCLSCKVCRAVALYPFLKSLDVVDVSPHKPNVYVPMITNCISSLVYPHVPILHVWWVLHRVMACDECAFG